jgi:outer membrane murein-binding lipoprotein Lpp
MKKSIKMVVCGLFAVAIMSACGNDRQIDELNSRVDRLQRENERLSEEINRMRENEYEDDSIETDNPSDTEADRSKPETTELEADNDKDAESENNEGGNGGTSYVATAITPPSDPPVIPDGFVEIQLKITGGDYIRGWSDGTYTIFYGYDGDYTGWILYENDTYRYVRFQGFLLNY